MKKKILFLLLFVSFLFLNAIKIDAQEIKIIEQVDNSYLGPIIQSADNVILGKKMLFDASDSELLGIPALVSFQWDFGDESPIQYTEEVLHEYKKTGQHKVSLTIKQGERSETVNKDIYVYDKKIFLITDKNKFDGLRLIAEQAAQNGVLLKVIAPESKNTISTEEKLVQEIKDNSGFIESSDVIIFYNTSSSGLKAFTRFWQLPEIDFDIKSKLLVKISDENIVIDSKIVQQNFDVILPSYILLTRKEALNPIFESKNYSKVVSTLQNRGIEYKIIDERARRYSFFLLSTLITSFIAQGIPTSTLFLILSIPFITFIITFARHFIGLSTFGVYTPTVLVVTFLILGIKFGLASLLIVVLVSYVLKIVMKRIELLHTPRISLVLSTIILSFLGVIWFLLKIDSSLSIPLAIFPLIVMTTISEKFTAIQSEEGLKGALLGAAETIFVTVIAFYFISWPNFSNLLISIPELVFIPLLLIIVLGKFTGLRVVEYFRFRSLFKDQTEE